MENCNVGVANIARIAIRGLVLAMGLKAMGLADDIVTMAFGFTIGSVAVAAAIAFGLGGTDAAKANADDWTATISKSMRSAADLFVCRFLNAEKRLWIVV